MKQSPKRRYKVGSKRRSAPKKSSMKKIYAKKNNKRYSKKKLSAKKRSSKQLYKVGGNKQEQDDKTSKKKYTRRQNQNDLTQQEKDCRKEKISVTMGEFKRQQLKMKNGKEVTNPKQAIAIALSQADRDCLNKQTQQEISDISKGEWIINPLTKRRIKVGGKTYIYLKDNGYV